MGELAVVVVVVVVAGEEDSLATGLGPGVTVTAGLGGSFSVGLAWATGLAVGFA